MNASAQPQAGGKANIRSWDLEVIDSYDVEPNMRRVVFTCDDIAELSYKPGQAIVFMLPTANGEVGRRHYTIRYMDRPGRTFSVDFQKHGEGLAVRWAMSVKPGSRVEAKGPRGGAWIRPQADWHILTGDESCIPAIAHMLETMPIGSPVHAVIEVDRPEAEIPIELRPGASLRWLHRNGAKAGPSDLMVDALADLLFPAGYGYAIIIGETSNVRRQRHALLARGMSRDQISSEGYWRPGRVGGHDHVED